MLALFAHAATAAAVSLRCTLRAAAAACCSSCSTAAVTGGCATPQDWALAHADPLYRRTLAAFIDNKRALAYRFGDAGPLMDDEAGGLEAAGSPGGAVAAASLPRRLLAGRPAVPRPRPWCTENIRAGGGFGVVRMQLALPA
ncbi:uncharacterized protein LOC142568093 [Dermacentor variabilis]|uniref:uncharacterized protein LOC142568093 n=1 Tax=Dermacentor variabilis TaxID=34621 RepID=UPI003F5BDB5F